MQTHTHTTHIHNMMHIFMNTMIHTKKHFHKPKDTHTYTHTQHTQTHICLISVLGMMLMCSYVTVNNRCVLFKQQ